jgi:hypothetical protein
MSRYYPFRERIPSRAYCTGEEAMSISAFKILFFDFFLNLFIFNLRVMVGMEGNLTGVNPLSIPLIVKNYMINALR